MKSMFRFIVSLLLLSAMIGCGSNPYTEEIAIAESLADSQPDSALVILRQTNPKMVTNRKAKAHYNLLYSKVLDKNYILLDSDSLIAPAFRYYTAPIRRRFISDSMAYAVNYYYATILQNAEEHHEAVEYFLKSKEYAERVGDDFILGLIYARMGEIYRRLWNFHVAADNFQMAYHYYSKASKPRHSALVLFNIAESTSRFDVLKSKQIYEEVADMADSLNYTDIKAQYLYNMVAINNSLGKYGVARRSVQAAKKLAPPRYKHTTYCHISAMYSLDNQLDSAKLYLDTCAMYQTDIEQKTLQSYTSFLYHLKAHNIDQAYRDIIIYENLKDSITLANEAQYRSTAESEYYRHMAELSDMQSKWQSYIYITILIIGVISIIFVTREYRQRTRFQNLEIDRLTESMESMTRLKAQIEQEKDSAIKHVQEYALSKFEIINHLGLPLYERTASKDQQEDIYRQMRNYINALKCDAKMKAELEQLINTAHENIIARIRVQMPKLRSRDIDLLLYILSGFSTQMISILIDDSVPNVYAKKSRLKGRIAASDAPDREFFVKKLS